MKKRNKKIVYLIVIIISIVYIKSKVQTFQDPTLKVDIYEYEIDIRSDADFLIYDSGHEYWIKGSGTEEDPYRLEFEISSLTMRSGISISDTTKYFVKD